MRMAEARNKALAGFTDEHLDWLVVIDADLYARPWHIWQLIEVLQRDSGVAMACAGALQNFPDIFGRSPWSYYDSFALVDQGGRLGMTGARVPSGISMTVPPGWPVDRCLFDLRLAELRFCRWHCIGSHHLQWQGDQGCEHWAFCLAAGQAGRVMACPDVMPLVIQDDSIAWHPTYANRCRQQLKAFWRNSLM